MYYLFYLPASEKMIQLTFVRNRVDTYTSWSASKVPTDFKQRTKNSGKWSTKSQWLKSGEFTLLATSQSIITGLTHPEFSI